MLPTKQFSLDAVAMAWQPLPKTGSHGSLPGNCHRDLCASSTKDRKISGSTPVETKCKDPKTSQVSMEKLAFCCHTFYLQTFSIITLIGLKLCLVLNT